MYKWVWPWGDTMLFMCAAPAPMCGYLSGTPPASGFMSTLVCASCPKLSSTVRQNQKSKNVGLCFPIRWSHTFNGAVDVASVLTDGEEATEPEETNLNGSIALKKGVCVWCVCM